MKFRKHYEPQALAAWQALVDRSAATIKRAMMTASMQISDEKALSLAREKHDTERHAIPISHLDVIETGETPLQRFDDAFIERGVREGWADLSGNQLSLKTEPEVLIFKILRPPGYYCVSSGARIPLTERAMALLSVRQLEQPKREADVWLRANGKEPRDYEVLLSYEVELKRSQHDKWRAVRAPGGATAASHTLEG